MADQTAAELPYKSKASSFLRGDVWSFSSEEARRPVQPIEEKEVDSLVIETGESIQGLRKEKFTQLVEPSRLYPHKFDNGSPEAKYREELSRAIDCSENLADRVREGDLNEVSRLIGVMALSLRNAQEQNKGNRSFVTIVAFIRRALLAADVGEVDASGVQSLISALRRLEEDPFLSLAGAAGISSDLLRHGWNGSLDYVSKLIDEFISILSEEKEVSAGVDNVRAIS